MCIRKYLIIIILSLIGLIPTFAQKEQTEICIDFRVNSIIIDTLYNNNAKCLNEILYHINQLRNDTTRNIMQVTFSGVASPEGNFQLNKRLASNRLLALEKYIRSHINIPEDLIIRHNDTYIPWTYLIAEIKTSEIDYKEEILSILNGPSELVPYHNNSTIDSRIPALQKLDNGRIWRILSHRFFPKMRNACFILITLADKPKQEPMSLPNRIHINQAKGMDSPILPSIKSHTETAQWIPQLHLKSNFIGLGMGIANLAIEADITKHWSFTLPVYFSAWDYFKTTIKFRTFSVQPEFRYWHNPDNEGWYVGAHFGLALFNVALDGDYRYQDHGRETPALGGGVVVGYRTHLSKNKRWKLELALGGGVYSVDYDKFHNTPDTSDGLMVASSVKKTYWGIDQAAVSIAYAFDLKKKGGKR